MKQFNNLSDKHKERAIHFAEHIVISNLIEDGVSIATDVSEEVSERFEKITALLNEAKKLEDPSDQAEFLLDNDLTGQMIFQEAYDLASSSLYIEKDEIAFELREIDSHYEEEDPTSEKTSAEDGGTEEIKANVVKSKKDVRQLN